MSDSMSEYSNMSMASTPSKTPKKTPKKAIAGKGDDDEPVMLHLTFDFLKPGKIKDAEGRSEGHENFDPRTLYVPAKFMQSQTPGHQQW